MSLRQAESTPLLKYAGENSSYYFLNNTDEGGIAEVEGLPDGADHSEFEPRVIGKRGKQLSILKEESPPSKNVGLFAKLFGVKKSDPVHDGPSMIRHPSMIKPRKAPIKVEPKVFFANERTFLAWMHVSIVLAGASIAILAFSDQAENPASQIYGIVMLPVAVAFIVYAMYQYVRRAYMIRNKMPGPYDDTVGPTVLGIMLMLSIVCQFAIKLYSMSF